MQNPNALSPMRKGFGFELCGDPTGDRTPDSAVRGLRLDLLTIGPYRFRMCFSKAVELYIMQCFFANKINVLIYVLYYYFE